MFAIKTSSMERILSAGYEKKSSHVMVYLHLSEAFCTYPRCSQLLYLVFGRNKGQRVVSTSLRLRSYPLGTPVLSTWWDIRKYIVTSFCSFIVEGILPCRYKFARPNILFIRTTKESLKKYGRVHNGPRRVLSPCASQKMYRQRDQTVWGRIRVRVIQWVVHIP